MTTYWHIAHPTYSPGTDLVCRDYLVRDGVAPEWGWTDADEGLDGTVICLFPDTPRGRTEADWLWFERKDHHLLRVELPDHIEVSKVEEGYPAVDHLVPAGYVTLICTGYADGVVTQDGDEY
jgi:hypothetical protein